MQVIVEMHPFISKLIRVKFEDPTLWIILLITEFNGDNVLCL
jgi:hypothetical protein